MKAERIGSSVFAGCAITSSIAADRPIARQPDGAARPFGDLFYMIHSMRSGRHHPDGVFWVRDGRHRVVEEKLPLTAVAPMVLDYFGVRVPEPMRRPSTPARRPEASVS
jgi:hypothetical protein